MVNVYGKVFSTLEQECIVDVCNVVDIFCVHRKSSHQLITD